MLKIESRGAVRWLTIDRAEQRNEVVWELFPLLIEAIQAAGDDVGARAIVITGAGDKWFCGGGDLHADEKRSRSGDTPKWLLHPIIKLFHCIEACPLPVVARVNGHAMAPGLSLLAMADLSVAADHARFGLPEARIGLANTLGLAYLQRLVPKRRLLELLLTAEPISAAQALEFGLVNHVVPAAELDAKLDWLLGRLLDKSPQAQRRAKFAFKAMEDMTLDQALRHGSASAANILLTPEFRAGVAAFHEGRAAPWTEPR